MSDQAPQVASPPVVRVKGTHTLPDEDYLKGIGLMPLPRAAEIAGMLEVNLRAKIAGKVTIVRIGRRPFVKIDEFNSFLRDEPIKRRRA